MEAGLRRGVMMQYGDMVEGVFVDRPNRFISHVLVNGETVICHVKNTGRCKELLIPGCRVWLQCEDRLGRKTPYSLITVEKGDKLVNLDSQAPNRVAYDWIQKEWQPEVLLREKKFGNSRFDLYFEKDGRKGFVEVKGVTLEEDGVALFPDAPTERGVKHIRELISCVEAGYEAYCLFVIQMKGISLFKPNERTHPEFGAALREAAKAGVKVMAVDCLVTERSLAIDRELCVDLNEQGQNVCGTEGN